MIDRRSVSHLLVVVGYRCAAGRLRVRSVATGETRNDTVSFDLDDSKSTRVELHMGSGELQVSSGTPKLMEGQFAYNVADWKPVVDTAPAGERAEPFRSRVRREQLRQHREQLGREAER